MTLKHYFILFFLFSVCKAYSGITGTLAGTVMDKETKKPLAGVNIQLKNTKLGAATDENGFFLINNIPVGRYAVLAQMMGYSDVVRKDVVILIDLRTTLSFSLEPTVLEMDAIETVAKAPLIRHDITGTVHFVPNDEIRKLPVQSFKDIVDIQPGVAAGHIRGGRESEVLYLVDGFPIQEAIEGKVGSELPLNSIVDMAVQTGGFNAEYGNAMSGIVNIITKDGGNRFDGLTEISTILHNKFENPFHDRPNDIDYLTELSFGGPIIKDRIQYYVGGDVRFPYNRWKREEFGQRLLVFNNKESYNTNLNSKLSFHPTRNLKINLQGLLSLWNWTEYDHKWKKNIKAMPLRTKNSYRISLVAIHTLSPKTFYEARFSQYNVLKSIQGVPSLQQATIQYEEDNPNSWIIAGSYPWWLDHQEIHTHLKLDLTSQVNKHHQLKTGIEIVQYDLYKKNVQRMDIETYDLNFPQFITYNTEYQYYPLRGSAYIQDKIEHEGMVVNAGFRYDFLDPKAERPALEEKIYGDRSEWIIEFDKKTKASLKHQYSPRIGVALPIGPKKEVHINYGYFFQIPLFDYLYTNSNLNTAQGFAPLGDPDLKPAKTISYEVSYKNVIGEKTLFDLTIFNKDVTNLIDNNTFLNSSVDFSNAGFTRYVNLENVNVRGTEVFLKHQIGRKFSGKLSYTFMVAKGTGSENTQKYQWLTKDTRVPISEYYLSWDQRHTFVANLDISDIKSFGMNVLWKYNSPLPYTHYKGYLTEPNNARMKNVSILDVRINRTLEFNSVDFNVFIEALNIFDRKNMLWVDSFGIPGGDLGYPGAWDQRFRLRLGITSRF